MRVDCGKPSGLAKVEGQKMANRRHYPLPLTWQKSDQQLPYRTLIQQGTGYIYMNHVTLLHSRSQTEGEGWTRRLFCVTKATTYNVRLSWVGRWKATFNHQYCPSDEICQTDYLNAWCQNVIEDISNIALKHFPNGIPLFVNIWTWSNLHKSQLTDKEDWKYLQDVLFSVCGLVEPLCPWAV